MRRAPARSAWRPGGRAGEHGRDPRRVRAWPAILPRLVRARTAGRQGIRAMAGPMIDPLLSRRELLAAGVGLGAGLALAPQAAARRRPTPGRLADIEHVVIMIQENRSFDHYFGRFPGVRGFGDRSARAAFAQPDGAG